MTQGEIIEKDFILLDFNGLRSDIPVDELAFVEFLQSENNFTEVIESDGKGEDIIGLGDLCFEEVSRSIVGDDIVSALFVELLDNTENFGWDDFFDDFEVVLINIGEVVELVEQELLIVFASFVDKPVVAKGVNTVVLFVLLNHNDIM